MPYVNGVLVTAEDAFAAGLCPECGEPLANQSLTAHAEVHWGVSHRDRPVSVEGEQRRQLVLSFKAK